MNATRRLPRHSSRLVGTPLLCAAALALAACASNDSQAPQKPGNGDPIAQAVTTPLGDLNLVKAEIPAVLVAAQKAPYGVPADRSCAGLATQVHALDAALGADLDTPATASNPSLIERSGGAVSNAAVGAVRGAAEGIVPYRGWIRKLSGAERYSKEVEAAIAAGTIRRAFLKGLGKAANCEAPAAPRA